ncbi:phosphoethanolamine transferase [Kordiimonas aquimaris]|uniref:phosphoethanolamine transferase n=1 Tax=Kordiimonas aquimaris TaxID=707591 RepID=UPI0021D03EF1|nr:phosphoethanolamine transferase [Kordiimonas aquimaris]
MRDEFLPVNFIRPIDSKNLATLTLWLAYASVISYIAQMDVIHESTLKYIAHFTLQTIAVATLTYLASKSRFILLILVVIIFTDAVVKYAYASEMTISVWMSLLQTQSSETSAFLTDNIFIIASSFLLMTLLVLLPRPKFSSKITITAIMISLLYVVAPASINLPYHYKTLEYQNYIQTRLASGSSQVSAKTQFIMHEIGNRFALLKSLSGLVQSIDYIAFSNTISDNSWTNVVVKKNAPELLVIVIGESTRADNMSIYGYERDTTPNLNRLSETGHIKAYKNVYSAGTNTWNSLPKLLTHTPHNSIQSQTIIKLAKQAGYKPYWISNQQESDDWGRALVNITDQVNKSIFINSGEANVPLDSELIPHFNRAIEDTGKKLIILHLYATHSPFEMRYPRGSGYFKNTGNASDLETILNSYDNSIRYIDQLLSEIIRKTKQAHGSFIYFSDHGLTSIETARPLVHDIRKNVDISSLRVPLILAGKNIDALAEKKFHSLYYFECIFSAWSMISADELTENNFCKNKMEQQEITYIGADLEVRKITP